jgi:hypothetical protein
VGQLRYDVEVNGGPVFFFNNFWYILVIIDDQFFSVFYNNYSNNFNFNNKSDKIKLLRILMIAYYWK